MFALTPAKPVCGIHGLTTDSPLSAVELAAQSAGRPRAHKKSPQTALTIRKIPLKGYD
jgi:hypothetical protein